jgi:PilZ domain
LQSLFAQPESLVCPMDSVANSKAILNHSPVRSETRVSLQVRVDLRSVDIRTPSQDGLTDNISAKGARVMTSSPWNPDDRLNLTSLLGSLKSRARVIYCEPMGDGLFAIGLRLYATAGTWKLPS